jgi:hypothetical protein
LLFQTSFFRKEVFSILSLVSISVAFDLNNGKSVLKQLIFVNNYFRILIFTAAWVCFVGLWNQSFSQTLKQDVSADSLKAGDILNFSITLKKDRTYDRIIFPDSAGFTENFELRNRRRYRVSDFVDSLSYKLQFWATENDTFPALPVQLIAGGDTTTMYTEAVIIPFQSTLQSEDEDLRPLKPIFAFAAAWWPYLLGLLILLIAAGIGYYVYKKYKEQPEPEPAPEFKPQPFLNPLKELENNLRQTQNISPETEQQFNHFYIKLGDAIRRYFEQMYRIPALESTSREIIRELDRRAIDERMVEQTRIVLREADMVKFAKFTPSRGQAQKAYDKAQDFLSIAKTLHQSRIQQMRRQHMARVQGERKKFEDKHSEVQS